MTYQEIIDRRNKSKQMLINYFTRQGVELSKIHQVEIFNGRNRKCEAFQILCNNEEEFKKYKQIFFYGANKEKGGEFFIYKGKMLYVTIYDGWN